MQADAGPDGFLAMSAMADCALQLRLSAYLRERQKFGGAALEELLPRLGKELAKQDVVDLIRAIHRRVAWIAEHERELSNSARWQEFLAQLMRNLYGPGLPFAEDDLVALLEGHRKHRALWGFGPEELLVAHLEAHDLSPRLAGELRRFQAELKGGPGSMKYQNQAGYQAAVQQVHMLLWHDEADPLDPERCWSDRVRADLRAMTGARRQHWKALLRHIKGNAPAKPAKGWIKEAQNRLAAVGIDDFRESLAAWFAPFQGGQPQPLSVAGSHILRGLVWYIAQASDPALTAMALTLLDASWKAKRNVDKAMVALVSVIEALPPSEAWPWLLRLQQEWPTSSVQVERLLKKTATGLGISEEELRARALLKPTPAAGEEAQRFLARLSKSKAMVRPTR